MTLYIIGITIIISLAAFSSRELKERLMLNPYMMKRQNQWYRYITSGFIHDDEVHLLANMFTLYMFGEYVDFFYGALFGKSAWLMYCVLYITSIFAANVSTYLKYQDSAGYRSLGASGATSAIVFAAILYKPYLQIWGLPGFIMGIAYLAYSYYAGRKGGDHINHEAHFYGAIYGVLFTIVLKPIVAQIFFNQLF
jgi:membrane associated rhomboid family serine protease